MIRSLAPEFEGPDLETSSSEEKDATLRSHIYRASWKVKTTLLRAKTALSLHKHLPEGTALVENEHYRPMHELIQEGIDTALKINSDLDVHLDEVTPVGHGDFFEFLRKSEVPVRIDTIGKALSKKGPRSNVFIGAEQLNTSFRNYLRDTGRGELADKLRTAYANLDGWNDESFVEISGEWNSFSQELSRPLSTSTLFAFFLLKDQGDIKRALYDTTMFLKFKARGMFRNTNFMPESIPHQELVGNFREEFLDEFSTYNPYDSLTDLQPVNKRMNVVYDLSVPNQIGKPYHAFHLVALSLDFTPELIGDLLYGEYFLLHRGQHGSSKMLSDALVMSDLPEIHQALGKFSQK